MADSLFGYMNVFLAVYTAGEEESAEAHRRDQENDRQNKIKYVRTPIPEIQVETNYRQDQGHETEQAVQHINHLRSSKNGLLEVRLTNVGRSLQNKDVVRLCL